MAPSETELTVEELVDILNDKGKGVPKKVSGFPNLPYDSYEILLSDIQSGYARLFRFAYAMEPGLLSLLGIPSEKFANTFALIVAYGGIIASIALAYFISWWLLILIPVAFVMGGKLTKNSYNSAILRTASSSELIFCFLYFSGQVSVDVPSTGDHYFFERD